MRTPVTPFARKSGKARSAFQTCTCMSQRPGMTNLPRPEMIRAPAGAAIRVAIFWTSPAWMSTSTSLRGGASVMPMTVTCCRTRSGDWAGARVVVRRSARARTRATRNIVLRRTDICSQRPPSGLRKKISRLSAWFDSWVVGNLDAVQNGLLRHRSCLVAKRLRNRCQPIGRRCAVREDSSAKTRTCSPFRQTAERAIHVIGYEGLGNHGARATPQCPLACLHICASPLVMSVSFG